jgi:hypothetical protein
MSKATTITIFGMTNISLIVKTEEREDQISINAILTKTQDLQKQMLLKKKVGLGFACTLQEELVLKAKTADTITESQLTKTVWECRTI